MSVAAGDGDVNAAGRQALPRRHPTTGRFLAFDCEVDCLTACAGLCGASTDVAGAVDRADEP